MKIVTFDLEASSLSGMVGRVLTGAVKDILPDQSGEIRVFRGDDKEYRNKKDLADDGKLVVAIRDELEKANILVGHNSKLFDRKLLNARLLKAGERPLDQRFHIDTMWIIRSGLRTSSALQKFSDWLDFEDKKTPVTWDNWMRAMGFDKDAMDYITDHNIQDVIVTEQVYWTLLPLIRSIRRDG